MRIRKPSIIVVLLMILCFYNLIDNKVFGTEVIGTENEIESVYDTLISADSLESFWQIMMAEENREAVLEFSLDEIYTLTNIVDSLYNGLENPTADDTEYKDMLIETLTILPNAECLECGEINGHADDCTKNYGILPADGLTISANTTISATTISGANTVWNFSSNVTATISGTITIPNGKTLTINGPGTLKRTVTGDMFLVKQGGSLIINNVIIDGNNTSSTGAIIHLDVTSNSYPTSRIANLSLNSATIKNSKRTSGMGGAIKLGDDNSYSHMVECNIINSTIDNCDAPQGSAVMMHANCAGNIKISNSVVKNCDATSSYAGTIRTQGTANCKLTIESCEIINNTSVNNGGGVYWNARGTSAKLTITGTANNPTIISNNSATNGGGVFLSGQSISIENTHIKNNSANYGAGICMQPYDYSGTGNAKGCTLNLGVGSKILNNTAAEYGGGIYMQIDSGSTIDGENFNINISDDATILGNSAKYGGAIAVTEKIGNAEYAAGATRKYNAYINISGGIIGGITEEEKNKATIDGGAFYVSRAYGDEGTNYALDINITDGLILGNKAGGNGGAIYFTDNATNSNAQINVSGGIIGNDSDQVGNYAVNGGAIYISGGNFSMTGGTLINNYASEAGGAVYVTGGKYTMSGGIVDKNSAQNGGSAFITGGAYILNGGTISNNKATSSGGAIYVNKGNFEMSGGIVSNNQAIEYGGGIYASSDTTDLNITVTSGSIIGNVANKNGGGVGIDIASGLKGIITIGLESCKGINNSHSHPIVKENTANENGGGIWFNGDNLVTNMYCGTIINNIALLEEGSANIYQTGGTTTVYAGDVGEGVIVIGGEYDYVPNEEKKVNITYNSNIPNNIVTNTAQVTVGVEIFLPEKLYTRNGYNLIGWSYSAEPGSDDEIFTTGEVYNVTDSDVTVYAVWRIFGAGVIESPIIKSGKHYSDITGTANIMITSNSSFTALMSVKDMDPSLYGNRILSFDKNLPNGTTILLIDKSNDKARKIYSYKVLDDTTKEIYLNNFSIAGTNEKFVNVLGTDYVDETLLFVVELPQNSNLLGPTQMILTRKAIDEAATASIKQKLSFTTTEKREFDFVYEIIDIDNDNKNTINDNIKLSFSKTTPNGEDTRYSGKKLSLVISGIIPEDAKIIVGNIEYTKEADSKFVIPFGIVSENIEKEIKIESETLLENENKVSFDAILYSTLDISKPHMYEEISRIENINLSYNPKPAINLKMSGRVRYADEMEDSITLLYDSLNIDEGYDVILSVQKKNDLGEYVTNSSLVQSVSGGINLGEGKYKLDLSDSGKIKITFLDNLILEEGTYRVYLEVKNDEKVILKVPYNFIILEKEEA